MTLLIGKNFSILFLHVPKCGGSSIVETFAANGYSPQLLMRGLPPQECLVVSPQHQTFSSLKDFIRVEKLTDIFILVRNPYERIKSEFNWTFRDTTTEHRPDFSEWILESLALASEDRSHADNHFRPAINFVDINTPVKVFRLEDGIELAIEFFLQEAGDSLPTKISHEKNSAKFPNSCDSLNFNNKALDKINTFYKYDFAAFGYTMIGEQANSLQHEPLEERDRPGALEKVKAVSNWRNNTLIILKKKLAEQINLLDMKLKNKAAAIDNCIHGESSAITAERYSFELICDDLLVRLSHAKNKLENSILRDPCAANPETISKLLVTTNQYRERLMAHNSLSSTS